MAPSIELQDFDAILFDLDGVLTTIAARSRHRGAPGHVPCAKRNPVTASHYGQVFTVAAESDVSFPGQYRAADGPAPGSPAPAGADPPAEHEDPVT